jgi:tRNA dimethylallyltransferase
LDALFGTSAARKAYCLPEAEVISADSMQAYRGMDIGTAKPDAALLARLPHRLLDIRDISEQYTVGEFVHLAEDVSAEILRRGKLPIISGGTGFYVRNFMCGLPSAPPSDAVVRAQVALDLARRGSDALREELAATDPGSAARIHANDLYRLTRALEIVRSTGRPMADFASGEEPRPDFRFLTIGLDLPRGQLYSRIEARVDSMVASGLSDEVAALRKAGHGPDEPGMRAIGYREFFEFESQDKAVIVESIKRDTRLYAKRQMTFFRGLPGIEWLGTGAMGGAFPSEGLTSAVAARIRAIVQADLSGL